MNKIIKSIIATLGAINYIFKLFLPFMIIFTMIQVFNLTGFNKFILILVALLTVIYEVIKVAGLDVILNIFKNILKND